MIKYSIKGADKMKVIHILNPVAGQGGAVKYKDLEGVYITRGKNDATEFVKKTVAKGEPVHFNVYGGDGTVNEVVNGLIGAPEDTSFSIVPVGTGNDLLRTFELSDKENVRADVLTVSGRYAVNAVNTGFDLDVVLKAAEFKKKPFISGTLAYALGVVAVLCKKFGKDMRIEYTDENGKSEVYEGTCLLTVCANGQYYGGGFHCSPAADISDGLIDLMIIKKVTRLKFITLIGKFMKGRHIDLETLKPIKSFEKYMIFKKCKSITIKNIDRICADGEIWDTNEVKVDILPSAVTLKRRKSE